GAEQVAVADLGLAVGHVRVDGTLAVESTQDQGPLRVCGDLLLRDLALVHEGLHQSVVVGDLLEARATQKVGPGVADVDEGDTGTGDRKSTRLNSSHVSIS